MWDVTFCLLDFFLGSLEWLHKKRRNKTFVTDFLLTFPFFFPPSHPPCVCVLLLLAFVPLVLCFSCRTPMLCQRRCRLRRRQEAEDQAAEIIRVSLRNLNLLGIDDSTAGGGLSAMFPSTFGGMGGGGGGGGNGGGSGGSGSYSYARGLSPEDRSEFIKNILVSRVRENTVCALCVLHFHQCCRPLPSPLKLSSILYPTPDPVLSFSSIMHFCGACENSNPSIWVANSTRYSSRGTRWRGWWGKSVRGHGWLYEERE